MLPGQSLGRLQLEHIHPKRKLNKQNEHRAGGRPGCIGLKFRPPLDSQAMGFALWERANNPKEPEVRHQGFRETWLDRHFQDSATVEGALPLQLLLCLFQVLISLFHLLCQHCNALQVPTAVCDAKKARIGTSICCSILCKVFRTSGSA